MRRGVEGGRVRAAQRDDTPAEAAAGHAGAEHAGLREQVLDQLVDRGHGDAVVDRQAAMPLGHEGAEGDQVAPAQEALRLAHPGALGDDVAGPPAQHGIGERAEVAELAGAEGPAEDVGGPFALGAPRGVGRAGEEAGRLAVDDDERRVGGTGTGRVSRVAKSMWRAWPAVAAGDRQRIEQADVGPRGALGLLAVVGERQGVGVVAEGEQQRDREGGARGQAGPDRERAGHPDGPARTEVAGAAGARPPGRPPAGTGAASSPRAISTGRPGNWSESIPTRKLPGLGVKVTSVARSMAIGSERPPL